MDAIALWKSLPLSVQTEIIHTANIVITNKFAALLTLIIEQARNPNADAGKKVAYSTAGFLSGAFLASLVFSNPVGIAAAGVVALLLGYNKARTGKTLAEYIATYNIPDDDPLLAQQLADVILPNLAVPEQEQVKVSHAITDQMLATVMGKVPSFLDGFYDGYSHSIISKMLTVPSSLSLSPPVNLEAIKTAARLSEAIYDKNRPFELVVVGGNALFVVFRGTSSAVDVFVDAATYSITHHKHQDMSVHGGIGSSHKNDVGKKVKAELLSFFRSNGRKIERVLCVGHSLGGAYALLLAIDLLSKKQNKKAKWASALSATDIQAITFGAPLVIRSKINSNSNNNNNNNNNNANNDKALADFASMHTAIVNGLDIIPRLLFCDGNVLETLALLGIPNLPKQKDIGVYQVQGTYHCLTGTQMLKVTTDRFFLLPPGVVPLVGAINDHLMSSYLKKLDRL